MTAMWKLFVARVSVGAHVSMRCCILEVSASQQDTQVRRAQNPTGTPADYNQWKALGNDGWGYDDLEPYFMKSEKCRAHPGSKFRGHKGT